MIKKLTDLKPGMEVWMDLDDISIMQRFEPKRVTSTNLFIPGENEIPYTVVVNKSGRAINVEETPEQILSLKD